MSKNKFRYIHIIFFMNLNGNTFTIIHNRNEIFILINFHLQSVHFFVSLVVISSLILNNFNSKFYKNQKISSKIIYIDQNFVKNFEKPGNIINGSLFKLFLFTSTHDPLLLGLMLNRPNIGIRSKQNMFKLSFLLIGLFNRFFKH